MQVGAKSGMVSMDAALADLVAKGLVSPDDVRGKIPEQAEQQRAAQGGAR
jgi:Tfp pilus assembly pilus retraction ATPase PilT